MLMDLEWFGEKLGDEYGDYLLESRAHNSIVQNLSYNVAIQLKNRMIQVIHTCLNHDDIVCRSISLSMLLVKTQHFHQIIIISHVNMNCQSRIWY